LGALIGLINGLLVRVAKIDSFIATLGVGTILYATSQWYTGGQQISGTLPAAFVAINGASPLGIPIPALYVLVLAIFMWLAFEYLPIGRYLYAIGSNERAAELIGIPITRYVIGAFVASGTVTAFAGIVLGAKLQVGQSNIGPEYLLPAFVGALLGSTSVKPGRVNVWGTIIAVLILAVGISGIQQMGASFFVEPLFNGLTLIVAVGLAGYFARRRLRVAVALPDQLPPPSPQTPTSPTSPTSQGAHVP
jgi:ribose transport system permease protein